MSSVVLAVAADQGSIQAILPVVEQLLRSGRRCILVAPSRKRSELADRHGDFIPAVFFEDGMANMTKSIEHVFAEYAPAVLLTGSSVPRGLSDRTIEQIATVRGGQAGIPVVTVLDAWGYYSERFGLLQGQARCIPTLVCALDENCRRDLIACGVPSTNIKVTNNPWMDQFCLSYEAGSLDSDRKRILFVSQPLAEVKWPRKWQFDQRDLFDMLMRTLEVNPDIGAEVDIWVHPAERKYNWPDLARQYPGVVRIQQDRSAPFLAGMDALVTSHSTIIYQALHLNVPCIVLRPTSQECDDHLPDQLGLTAKVTDPAQLAENLRASLSVGKSVLRDKTELLKKQSVFFSNGQATVRVIEILNNYLGALP